MPCRKFQISEFKISISRHGYTLIEFLIVIGILGLSVGSVLLFLTTVIKSSNQANITSEVKQNAQSVIDNLQGQIRNATDVGLVTGGYLAVNEDSAIVLTQPNTQYLTIACFNSQGSSSGYIATATSSSPNPQTSGFSKLTNDDPKSGVDINCSGGINGHAFTLNSGATSVKLVEINFVANQGKQAPSRVDFLANAEFKTTVSLRQYK